MIVAVIAASQIAQICFNWTSLALARFGVEEFVESETINKSFWTRSLILLPNVIILILLSKIWFPLISDLLKLSGDVYWLLIAHIVVFAFWIHIQHALQGAKLPRMQGGLLAVERIFIFAGLLGLALTGRLDPLTALWAYILSPLPVALIGILELRKLLSWKISFDFDWLKKILKFSVPLIPFAVVGYFSTGYFDAVFISNYLSKADLGMYSVVYQISGILMQFPSLAGVLLMPLFVTFQTNKQNENINLYLKEILPLVTFCWSGGCVLVAAAAGFVLPWFFGPEFDPAGKYLMVLGLGATFAMPLLTGYSPFTNAVSATYISMIGGAAGALVNVGLNFYLIPRYGLLGCAWATAFAFGTSFFVMMLVAHWRFRLRQNWTTQAVLPMIAGAAAVSWTNSIWTALVIFGLFAFGLSVFRHKVIIRGFRFLFKFKNNVRGLESELN